jgi:ABC-type bacteriocin/lantibiotic exporter with double-glycine peptidase domain
VGKWQEAIDQRVLHDAGKAVRATGRMLWYLRPYKRKVVLYVVLTCLTSLPPLVTPRLLQMIIDQAYPQRDFALLAWICGGMVAVSTVGTCCWAGATYLSTYLANMVRYRLAARVFRALDSLPLRTVENQGKGVFLERTQRDVLSISFALPSILSRLGSLVVTFVIALGIIGAANIWFCAAVLIIIPLNYGIVLFLTRTLRQLGLREKQVMEDVSSFVDETVAGFRDAKVFGTGVDRRRRLRQYLRSLLELGFRNWRASTFWGQTNSLLMGAWGILILYLGWYLVFTGRFALGQAVALGMYVTLLFKPFQWLAETYGMVTSVSVSADRVLTILNEAQKAAARERLPALSHGIASIELRNVAFSYEDGVPAAAHRYALSGISLRLERGTTVAIAGPNGSGKSTLLRVLTGLDDRYTGSILINGQDLREVAPRSYVKQVSCALQKPFFFTGPIAASLAPSRNPEEYKKSREFLEALGIQKLIESLPDGYGTTMGAGGILLSAGQQQILSLARALAKPSSLLLLDEITACVDEHNRDNLIAGLLRMRNREGITLFVTHSPALLRQPWVDRIIFLSEGRIAGDRTGCLRSQERDAWLSPTTAPTD